MIAILPWEWRRAIAYKTLDFQEFFAWDDGNDGGIGKRQCLEGCSSEQHNHQIFVHSSISSAHEEDNRKASPKAKASLVRGFGVKKRKLSILGEQNP